MKALLIAVTGLSIAATGVIAQDFGNQIKARQGQMWTQALSLGVLGDMAKGERDYDATAAQEAADMLAGTAMADLDLLWLEGSDNIMLDTTRANPSIWDEPDDFAAKWGAFVEAATAMQSAAGEGLDALRPAMGPVGQSCQACHDKHRGPRL